MNSLPPFIRSCITSLAAILFGVIAVFAQEDAWTFHVLPGTRTVVFVGGEGGGFSCRWDFGDGVVSRRCNPVHTYNADGAYTVTLKTSGAFGRKTVSMTLPRIVGNAPTGKSLFWRADSLQREEIVSSEAV